MSSCEGMSLCHCFFELISIWLTRSHPRIYVYGFFPFQMRRLWLQIVLLWSASLLGIKHRYDLSNGLVLYNRWMRADCFAGDYFRSEHIKSHNVFDVITAYQNQKVCSDYNLLPINIWLICMRRLNHWYSDHCFNEETYLKSYDYASLTINYCTKRLRHYAFTHHNLSHHQISTDRIEYHDTSRPLSWQGVGSSLHWARRCSILFVLFALFLTWLIYSAHTTFLNRKAHIEVKALFDRLPTIL